MKIGIHQPMYLPWLGLFDRMARCDKFVLLDSVPYSKNYFINRNRIKTAQGWQWLTVPVLTSDSFGQAIGEVKIDNSKDWQKQHWKSIYYAYKDAPHFSDYSDFFEKLYSREHTYLSGLIGESLDFLLKSLGICTPLVKASSLGAQGKKEDFILNLCKELKASEYLSGPSGEEYLDPKNWKKSNIKLTFHSYVHPKYGQLHGEFLENMSIIDLLFNCGADSLGILRNEG